MVDVSSLPDRKNDTSYYLNVGQSSEKVQYELPPLPPVTEHSTALLAVCHCQTEQTKLWDLVELQREHRAETPAERTGQEPYSIHNHMLHVFVGKLCSDNGMQRQWHEMFHHRPA